LCRKGGDRLKGTFAEQKVGLGRRRRCESGTWGKFYWDGVGREGVAGRGNLVPDSRAHFRNFPKDVRHKEDRARRKKKEGMREGRRKSRAGKECDRKIDENLSLQEGWGRTLSRTRGKKTAALGEVTSEGCVPVVLVGRSEEEEGTRWRRSSICRSQ